jgi:ferrochelatase
VREALGELGAGAGQPHLVFTAHSIPVAMADARRYAREYETTGRLIAAALGGVAHTFAYQSRSGSPRDPWLEPDVGAVIRDLAARGVGPLVAVPIGFVCDHVEVLYDLDVAARAVAGSLGLDFHRAATVGDHPAFLRLLAHLVRAASGGDGA